MNMDNEPRMQDRSPEGQMFAIESEIKNMMKEYEMAVRNGENQRAQMIADAIDKMQKKKIEIQGGIADMMLSNKLNSRGSSNLDRQILSQQMTGKDFGEPASRMLNRIASPISSGPQEKVPPMPNNFSNGGEASFPDLTGDGQVTQADILKGRGVYASGGSVGGISPEDNQMIQRAFSTQAGFDVGQTAQMLKDILVKKYPNIPEPQINAILSKGIEDYSKKPPLQGMAEGGEAIGDELAGMAMSQEEAMAEVGNAEKEMAMIQQLVTVVQQLLAEGISEDDLVAFLKEQGLDDEDIDSLMQMVLQSQSTQAPDQIGQELQGMM
jgi:ribosomal protein S20